MKSMTDFIEYLKALGDEKAARLYAVKPRTIKSWRLRDRTPRPEQARMIVDRSPVTYDSIYGVEKHG